MKITLNWLKQYVDFDWSPDELADRLTMLGLEVEGVDKVAGVFEGIVVAQVVTRDKQRTTLWLETQPYGTPTGSGKGSSEGKR